MERLDEGYVYAIAVAGARVGGVYDLHGAKESARGLAKMHGEASIYKITTKRVATFEGLKSTQEASAR